MIFYSTIFSRSDIFFLYNKNMHKSVIFLLSSLVMLLPFASDNIFSKAIGIQDDFFNVYVKYGNDIANDYEEEYNSSSSYANDNNYKSKNSDFIKKIKCNNINSKLNELENTSDIRDHLGVEAVSVQGNEELSVANSFGNDERNNGKFDIDCIDNNNNAGGERGMAQQGSPGHNQINPTNIYIMPGNLNNTAIKGEATSIARCNEGDTVLSGSYFISFPYTEEFSVPSNTIVDFALPTQDGWETEVSESYRDGDVTIQTFAQCFNNL